jgi:glucosamine--fructose-6-phosphate aminotransferase (isomerizing)
VSLNLEAIQGGYLSDLLNQPEALRATWDALRTASVFDDIAGACNGSRFQRVVLTGMGSSYFGLHPLCIELAANGWTPMMVETAELIHYYPHLLTPSTLVVAVSQSGKSVETVRMLEMNAKKATVIGVTNYADRPLAQQSDFAVLTAAGDEFSVSCKTYVAAQLAQRMVAAALCNGDRVERLHELEAAPVPVEGYLRNWKMHVAEMGELLRDVRDIFLVGRGPSLAAACTGALTIKESDHFHAEGMSSAAFRHGPFEMLHSGIFVGVFAGEAKTRHLNDGLLKDLSQTPARSAMFAADSHQPPCRLPKASETLRPIVEILPIQMITLALAALTHREPGKFERATKITVVE